MAKRFSPTHQAGSITRPPFIAGIAAGLAIKTRRSLAGYLVCLLFVAIIAGVSTGRIKYANRTQCSRDEQR